MWKYEEELKENFKIIKKYKNNVLKIYELIADEGYVITDGTNTYLDDVVISAKKDITIYYAIEKLEEETTEEVEETKE